MILVLLVWVNVLTQILASFSQWFKLRLTCMAAWRLYEDKRFIYPNNVFILRITVHDIYGSFDSMKLHAFVKYDFNFLKWKTCIDIRINSNEEIRNHHPSLTEYLREKKNIMKEYQHRFHHIPKFPTITKSVVLCF